MKTFTNVLWTAGVALALGLGVWGGLARLGGVVPALAPHHALAHGPLMVGGFLGTLFGIEGALAHGRRWGWAVPALTMAATAWLARSPEQRPAAWLLTAASGGALLAAVALHRRQPDLAAAVRGLGALCWLLGSLQWAVTGLVQLGVGWWMAFALLAVTSERLETSCAPGPLARRTFVAGLGFFLGGLLVAHVDHGWGLRIFGAGAVVLAAWGLRWDAARSTEGSAAASRFAAICLAGGYFWLSVAGAILLVRGDRVAGLAWDGVLHAFFLGFVFSSICARTPALARAMLGIERGFSPRFYVPLALLHLSLLLRIGADLAGSPTGRAAGAILNMVAIAVFVLSTLRTVLEAMLAERPAPAS